MRTKHLITAGALLATAALTLTACGPGAPDSASGASSGEAPLVIGAAVALSGFVSAYDVAPLNGLKLKVDEINDGGGLDGRRVEVIEEDTQSVIEGGATAARSLIEKGADVIVSSCDFDFGGPAATVAQQSGLVSFSLCAASPKFGVQGIGDLAFTPRGSVATESAVLSDLAIGSGWENIAVILDDSIAATTGLCSSFAEFFPAAGGSVVSESRYAPTDTSFTSQVETVIASGADAVLLCGYPPAGASVIRQLRSSGVDLPILTGNVFDGSYWVESVPDVSDVYTLSAASTGGDSRVAGANELFADYAAAYDGLPARGDAIYGYVIGQLVEAAVLGTDGSSDGAVLAEYLETSVVPTALGEFRYDSETHISLDQPWEVIEFTNGSPRSLEISAPTVDIALTDGV